MRKAIEQVFDRVRLTKLDNILDIGPMEGVEVSEFVEAGLSITCLNVKGKTPVKGAAYWPAGDVGIN